MVENPVTNHLLKARVGNLEKIHRPLYFYPPMTNSEANSVSWPEFKNRILPLARVILEGSSLEYLITPKCYSYGQRDVSIFAGKNEHDISTLTDFTELEGNNLFLINQILVNSLLNSGNNTVQITIGFNPGDMLLIGNHTLKRFHSHTYLVEEKTMNDNLKQVTWNELNWFDRLSLIEPFNKILHDFLRSQAKKSKLFPEMQFSDEVQENLGFSSVYFKNASDFQNLFPSLVNLYVQMCQEHKRIESIFTNWDLDPSTERYIPKEKADRQSSLKKYLDEQDYLSSDSVCLLEYIANNLILGKSGREKAQIFKANQVWFAKGFCGALTFSFSKQLPGFRLDIIPKAITTACSSKTLCGVDRPVVFSKAKTPATNKELLEIRQYWRDIQDIVRKKFIESEIFEILI